MNVFHSTTIQSSWKVSSFTPNRCIHNLCEKIFLNLRNSFRDVIGSCRKQTLSLSDFPLNLHNSCWATKLHRSITLRAEKTFKLNLVSDNKLATESERWKVLLFPEWIRVALLNDFADDLLLETWECRRLYKVMMQLIKYVIQLYLTLIRLAIKR